MRNQRFLAAAFLLLFASLVVASPSLLAPSARPSAVQAAPVAAADLDLSGGNRPFYVLTVLTSGTKKVKLPAKQDVAIVHLGLQNDGSTASVSGDSLIVMQAVDSMAANNDDGEKAIIFSQGSVTIQGKDAKGADDGDRVIQLQAVSHGCKVQFVLGNQK